MDTDDLTGVFDGLRPEDFLVGTTCVSSAAGDFRGEVALERFWVAQLELLERRHAAGTTLPSRLAVLASPTSSRTFHARPEEPVTVFLARVRREASRLAAHWLFFAHTTTHLPEQSTVAGRGPGAPGALVWQVVSVDPEAPVCVAGVAPIHADRLGDAIACVTGAVPAPLRDVLPS